jgi:hypothetical protein
MKSFALQEYCSYLLADDADFFTTWVFEILAFSSIPSLYIINKMLRYIDYVFAVANLKTPKDQQPLGD